MPKVIIVDRAGRDGALEAQEGLSLMENIRNAGYDELLALCGGSCSCATCHVYVNDDWIAEVGVATGDELELLDCSDHRTPGSRLSCQIDIGSRHDGLRVTIAPED